MQDISFELNPKIYLPDNRMKPEVRDRLIEISEEFLSQIAETSQSKINFDVLDVRVVGSNAGYNYTEHSDLDLHLVLNFDDICKEHPEVVQCLFNSEKSRFNLNYDITVKGIGVEVYVEDVRASTISNGIYSVLYDHWIKVPYKDQTTSRPALALNPKEYDTWVNIVEDKLNNEEETSQSVKSMINSLYMIRKNSLESEGELGTGNFIFKQIRSKGLLDKLKDKYYELRSKELTLEGVNRSMKIENLSPQEGDRVRMDHYSKLNNGQEGIVTGRIGELCWVTWDDGTKSKEVKGYLTVIERP